MPVNVPFKPKMCLIVVAFAQKTILTEKRWNW